MYHFCRGGWRVTKQKRNNKFKRSYNFCYKSVALKFCRPGILHTAATTNAWKKKAISYFNQDFNFTGLTTGRVTKISDRENKEPQVLHSPPITKCMCMPDQPEQTPGGKLRSCTREF